MSDHDAMARDLGRHLIEQLKPVLERHLNVAATVLPADALAVMVIGFSRTVTLSMLATMLGLVPEEARSELFDKAVGAFTDGIAAKKPEVLANLKTELARRSRSR